MIDFSNYSDFQIRYNGNSRLVKGLLNEEPIIVYAETERQAVEQWYCDNLNDDYFTDDSGNVINAAGNVVAEPDDNQFNYDGGSIYAVKVSK